MYWPILSNAFNMISAANSQSTDSSISEISGWLRVKSAKSIRLCAIASTCISSLLLMQVNRTAAAYAPYFRQFTHQTTAVTTSTSDYLTSEPGAASENQAQSTRDDGSASSPQIRFQDAIRQLQQRDSSEADDSDELGAEFTRYRLGPGDSIFINVQRFPDLSFQATLDLQGNIIVPLAGIMSLQGLTLEEARLAIQRELNRFIIDPVVGMTLVVQRPVQVTVLGEVVRPGLYPLGDPQLTFALLSAGGATRLANLKTVQIRRTLRDQTGAVVEQVEQNVDLFTPLANGQLLPDIQLADGDVVIIPALTPSEAEEYDRTLVARSNLAQPNIRVRVLSYPQSIGSLELQSGSDFLDAITALAPDQTVSNLREVALIRFNPETGEVIRRELDARGALTGDLSENPILEDNDVLVIGRNLVARITNFFNNFTQPFRDVLGFLLFFDTIGQSADTLFRPDSDDDN